MKITLNLALIALSLAATSAFAQDTIGKMKASKNCSSCCTQGNDCCVKCGKDKCGSCCEKMIPTK